jgi:hypothetical protein
MYVSSREENIKYLVEEKERRVLESMFFYYIIGNINRNNKKSRKYKNSLERIG